MPSERWTEAIQLGGIDPEVAENVEAYYSRKYPLKSDSTPRKAPPVTLPKLKFMEEPEK